MKIVTVMTLHDWISVGLMAILFGVAMVILLRLAIAHAWKRVRRRWPRP